MLFIYKGSETFKEFSLLIERSVSSYSDEVNDEGNDGLKNRHIWKYERGNQSIQKREEISTKRKEDM